MSSRARKTKALSTLDQIRRQADSYPVLTPEAELALARSVRAGDDRAREHLVGAHLRLVLTLAHKLRWDDPGLGLEDLVQEGALGLDTAARRFDPERGGRFSTFAASYIKGQMLRSIANSGRTVRLPVHVEQSLVAYRRGTATLAKQLQRTPTLSEIADALKLDDAQVAEYELLAAPLVSLDEYSLGRDGERTSTADLPDPLARAISRQARDVALEQEYARLRDAVYALNEPHQSVIRYRFFTDPDKPPTYAEIGRKLVPPRSRQRVHRIELEGLARLREALLPVVRPRRRSK